LLGRLGAKLPSDAIEASGDNARGYWESAGLVKADDQVLRVGRSSWFDPRPLDLSRLGTSAIDSRMNRIREAIERGWGSAPLLAIKDPRQCRFVPLIAEILAGMDVEPRAAIMLRNPAEIARSLESRDGTTAPFAHLLWLRHMIDAERATRGMPRTIVDYDAMLDDWRGTLARIAPLAGRDGWQPAEAEAAEITAFLDPGLRHHRADRPTELEQPLVGIVAAVDEALRALTICDDEAARGRLDQAYALLEAVPWLEGDIVHDELRHRRVAPDPASRADIDSPTPPPAPVAPPASDPSDDAGLIRASGLFDVDWYLAHYPDVAASGLDPIDHYLRIGAALGYNPGPLFDTYHYARQMAARSRAVGEAI
ncbi:MAG TPA: sulfotransferase family protein, partial [Sphingomonas sp.]|nr:sulfotransferase family protein [Sphingomonas sp.]